jgi:chemotaxis protein MotA
VNKAFTPIGLFIVLVSVIGGYVLEHGNLHVLWQPVELLIIGGAGLGAFIASCTPHIFKSTMKCVLKGILFEPLQKSNYIDVLNLLNEIFAKIRKEGPIKLEPHMDDPENSSIFENYPDFMNKKEALTFLTDSFRTIITTKILYYDLNTLLEAEVEAYYEELEHEAALTNEIAESFPGLGIVAAVLGVIITMGKISEPPEVLGHSIGAALVGTFLGILLCYGIVGPIARKMKLYAESEKEYLMVIKTIIIYFVSGINPKIALEFGRRAVPKNDRPSFMELETTFKEQKNLRNL